MMESASLPNTHKIRIINLSGTGEVQFDIIPPDKEDMTDEVAKMIEISRRFKK